LANKQLKLLLIGLGTVGQGLIRILLEKGSHLIETHGIEFKVVGVCTGSRGNLYHPEGLDLQTLYDSSLNREPFASDITERTTEWLIRNEDADIVVELSPTDLNDGQPAIGYCQAALESGKHVVSGNKGPAALAFTFLSELAKRQGLFFLNEATVLSGTSVFLFAQKSLAGLRINQIKGILNGSTNFILGQMELGHSYSDSIEMAKQLGYLEADPEGDIGGYDAQAKLAILSNILFETPIQLADVKRVGIADISREDVMAARAAGKRWKLIATLSRNGDHIQASVSPECLPEAHPLAQMNGTSNALTFSTDLLGDVTISGPGAGGVETGYAILTDLLIIHEGHNHELKSRTEGH
jgi:homoserine dehydrogenase